MRVVIVGAGPAGLNLAYLLKCRVPAIEIDVLEQNAPDATFGFGLVFSDRALDFLAQNDPETLQAIRPALEHWRDSILYLNGREIRIDGQGYNSIGRLRLLKILRERAASVGIVPKYNHVIDDLDALGPADLIVGADGANSVVRRSREADFGTGITLLTNRFAWYGTTKRFEALSHTFVQNELGTFNAHHHRHAPDMSTVVIEMDETTYFRAGFETMPLDQAQVLCERIFADMLQGHKLISNKSIWRQFPKITNKHWSVGNRVLLGDALHTAHFSIGSGTRLALEDAVALADALAGHKGDVPPALAAYQAQRAPVLGKLVTAANTSADWYEHFTDHMKLPPMEFALGYITRTGRVDFERLRKSSPEFIAAYEASKAS